MCIIFAGFELQSLQVSGLHVECVWREGDSSSSRQAVFAGQIRRRGCAIIPGGAMGQEENLTYKSFTI